MRQAILIKITFKLTFYYTDSENIGIVTKYDMFIWLK